MNTVDLIKEVQKTRPGVVRLARLVCLAVKVDSALLRRMRITLAPELDVGVEADLWFSPLVESFGPSGFVLEKEVATVLRRSLASEPELFRQVERLMKDERDAVQPSILVEEKVTALGLHHALPADIEQALRPVVLALADEERGTDIARWAMRALPRFPPEVLKTEAAMMLALGASARLANRRILDNADVEADLPQHASWMLPQEHLTKRVRIGVYLVRDAIEFRKPEGRISCEIQLPQTEPLWVGLSWNSHGQTFTCAVSANVGRAVKLPSDISELTLHTLAGDKYRVEPLAPRARRHPASETSLSRTRIYLSTTYEDLVDYRKAAIDALSQSGHSIIASAYHGTLDRHSIQQILAEVERCDIYIGIIGWRYGFVSPEQTSGGKSIVELEYERAIDREKPRLMFMVDPSIPRPLDLKAGEESARLEAFQKRLLEEGIVGTFKTPEELAQNVVRAVKLQVSLLNRPQVNEREEQPRQTAVDGQSGGLLGGYGFLTDYGSYPEARTRGRVAKLVQTFGIKEFQFYDWFATYSKPTNGFSWPDPREHEREIHLETILTYIDEIHRHGGRAWAYVQAVGADEADLADPSAEIYPLLDREGNRFRHPPEAPRFWTYFLNAAWADRMTSVWGLPVKNLGFDGIHWDTLGRRAGDYTAEVNGTHAFLRRAKETLAALGLSQTLNFVDLAWWDPDLVASGIVAFPYAEVWTMASEQRYYAAMNDPALGQMRGVMAFYPTADKPEGWTDSEVLLARWSEAPKHRLNYLILGDDESCLIGPYFPDARPLTPHEKAQMATNGRAEQTRTQSNAETSEPASPALPEHWILVAGLGSYELPEVVAQTAEKLGSALAGAGYGLVTGGWQGVDHIVARAFGAALPALGRREEDWSLRILVHNQEPDYKGGRMLWVSDDFDSSVKRADAVILISGAGGTLKIGETARVLRKPVLPLAATGGDAAELHSRMTTEWTAAPVAGVSSTDFDKIGPAEHDPAHVAVFLLRKVFAAQVPVS